MSPWFHAAWVCRTTSTFSCDIARPVSRVDRGALASEPRLRVLVPARSVLTPIQLVHKSHKRPAAPAAFR